jgi:hypothetical protein
MTFIHLPKLADVDGEPDAENYLSRTVYENEPQVLKIGILDASGNDIYMIDEPDPIGFVRWEN